MTNEEAIKKMQAVKVYMISGNPIWSVTEMGEAFDMAIEALSADASLTQDRCKVDASSDLISRQDAIDALWKALYDYEDKVEKQFQESDELDVGDWIAHRIFVQNMSDIDRQTILALPSAEPEVIRCKDCCHYPSEYADCPMIGWARNENDFCSKAERKDDD